MEQSHRLLFLYFIIIINDFSIGESNSAILNAKRTYTLLHTHSFTN